ncbi:hypothetical protein Tco_1511656 [Tanacetum coccineum]
MGSEQDSEFSNDDNDDVEKDDKDDDADDEDDDDEELINAEVDNSDKGDEEITNAARANAKNILEVKDDPKKAELAPSSSSLSVSLGFGDQFLKLSYDSSLVSNVKDTIDSKINSFLKVKIQSKVPHTQSPSMLSILVSVISEPTVLIPVQESPLIDTITTLHPLSISTTPYVPQQITTPIPTPTITTDAPIITTAISDFDALSAVQLRVAKLEKDVSDLKKIDVFSKALAALKTQVPYVVDNYFRFKVGDVFQKELKKHTSNLIHKYSLHQIPQVPKNQTPTFDLKQGSEKSALEILQIKREQAEKQQKLKFTIKSTDKAALKEYDLKSALYQSMHANKSFNRNPANHRLYHGLMKALIEDENAMDKGVAHTVKDSKRKHDDDEDDDDDPLAGPNQGKKTKRKRAKESESSKKPSSTKETLKGKALTKGSKTSKSVFAKELV